MNFQTKLVEQAADHVLTHGQFHGTPVKTAKQLGWALNKIFGFDILVEEIEHFGGRRAFQLDCAIGIEIDTIEVYI